MSTPTPDAGERGLLASRTYTAVFHDVWVAADTAAGALRAWAVSASDSRAGTLTLLTADLLGRAPAPIEVRLSLDEVGLTRLDIVAAAGSSDPARDVRRARRFLRRVDRLLAKPRQR